MTTKHMQPRVARVVLYLLAGVVLLYAGFLGIALVVGLTVELWAEVGPFALLLPAQIIGIVTLLAIKGRP